MAAARWLTEWPNFTPYKICILLNLHLSTTYFKYNDSFYRQKHGCAMGAPVSPIVANLLQRKWKAKYWAQKKAQIHCLRYVRDTWVKIRTQEVETFTEHMNLVDSNIKLDGHSRKPTHTDQYRLFDSNHPLERKLSVIRTLHHQAAPSVHPLCSFFCIFQCYFWETLLKRTQTEQYQEIIAAVLHNIAHVRQANNQKGDKNRNGFWREAGWMCMELQAHLGWYLAWA